MPRRRYPMVVSSTAARRPRRRLAWPSRWNAVLPAQGYFVLLPNPRGSYGQRRGVHAGNVKDFGYGDLRDI